MTAGLYVHVPFCPRKCGYCDFYSLVPDGSMMEPLVDALLAELSTAVDGPSIRIETIFAGGGTPTFLPRRGLERLMRALGAIAARDQVREFTVEANPGSLDEDRAAILRDHGVNRVSLGAQSFDERELHWLDRIHRPDQIAACAEVVRRRGFEHFNLDLMFGMPGQTAASWHRSLDRAIELGPDHLACYGLTYESGTPLHGRLERGEVTPAAEEVEARLYEEGIAHLAEAGFEQYEISNYARPGARCLHNLRYWHNRPSVGVGPSAAGYLNGRRWRNVPDLAEYMRRVRAGLSPVVETETLGERARAGETAMLALRLVEGIDRGRFRETTGFDPHELFGEVIEGYVSAGLLAADSERIALTDRGRLVADRIMADFLIPEAEATEYAETEATEGAAADCRLGI